MSVDFPRAWEIAREHPAEAHDPECSFRQSGGGLLCDCEVLTSHPEYRDEELQMAGGDEFAPTKRDQILELYESGTRDIAEIVKQVKARPSYVAEVLQRAGHIDYFDLYTATSREQNIYTRYFRNVLDFKDVDRARESVERINRLYNYFERLGDRMGQHHACIVALTGRNRAKWSGKAEVSEVFADWLSTH